MGFEWSDKEEICYRLYVEERKTLDEVMRYLKDNYNFKPSKRAFQTQFKRWEFPSKQHPAHKDQVLVERTRQLWEANTSQKEMLRILNEEGFDIKERELMRVRAKNRWLLRVPNGAKITSGHLLKKIASESEAQNAEEETMTNLEEPGDNLVSHNDLQGETENKAIAAASPKMEELLPDIKRKRAERLAKMQEESDERWAAKKRRRRTRGWAGLPADPPGPPRFPSETTIDESKAFLHLTNASYRDLRDQFQVICEDAGFIKKTLAGPEKWKAAKDRLISENQHLNNQFFGPVDGVPLESKALALDVLCTDVTKRMRTIGQRMTIAEAKSILQINPEQSRHLREQFHDILEADQFTGKIDAGDEHWQVLKRRWVDGSPVLKQTLHATENEEQRSERLKAIEAISRDVMKRLRDDQTRRDPSRKKQINSGPGPGPAPPKVVHAHSPKASMLSAAQIPVRSITSPPKSRNTPSQLQIDPSLLAAASSPSLLDQLQKYASEAAGQNYRTSTTTYEPTNQPNVAAYFRLSPYSQIQSGSKIWLGTIGSSKLTELRQVAVREHVQSSVSKVEGVISDENGNETMFPIERDDELGAYLQYVSGGKPTFSVQLVEKADAS